jgi:serine/threonine protein kinase
LDKLQGQSPATQLGKYRIESRLGKGGMGEVYLARDTELDRLVAIKILPPELAADPTRLQRFLQEAKAASALKHPNVATIYDFGEAAGVRFLAMEYVEGETLDRTIGGRPMAAPDIAEFAAQAADALEDAHQHGIVHRDIKPSNIMVTPRGQVKVLDFGLAKRRVPAQSDDAETEAMTSPGVLMGTVRYMSPEQALGRDVDGRSDLFSLGVVLYEMATGRPAFSAPAPTATIQKIVNEQPEAISRLQPATPPELERIIRKCLEKDSDRRYQSARDLIVDLKNLKRDTESGIRTAAAARPAAPRGLPHWLWAAAIAVVLALAAGLYLLRGRPAASSIVVLPFTSAGSDPDTEILSDGLTEQLINSLSQIPKLRVIARATAFHLQDEID